MWWLLQTVIQSIKYWNDWDSKRHNMTKCQVRMSQHLACCWARLHEQCLLWMSIEFALKFECFMQIFKLSMTSFWESLVNLTCLNESNHSYFKKIPLNSKFIPQLRKKFSLNNIGQTYSHSLHIVTEPHRWFVSNLVNNAVLNSMENGMTLHCEIDKIGWRCP